MRCRRGWAGSNSRSRYHRARDIRIALQPWFKPVRRLGIGVFVPPSAAEPWISRHPRFLRALETFDRFAGRAAGDAGRSRPLSLHERTACAMNAPAVLPRLCTSSRRRKAAAIAATNWCAALSAPGPLARQWAVRARSYEAFLRHVVTPAGRPLSILDLGAGNGWLCLSPGANAATRRWRSTCATTISTDWRRGAASCRRSEAVRMRARILRRDSLRRAAASTSPCSTLRCTMHAICKHVLAEAARVTRPGGTLAILDSPFYAATADGEAMVAGKAGARLGRLRRARPTCCWHRTSSNI